MKKLTNHERATKAAAARWGGRGNSKLIRVDADIPQIIKAIPTADRRRVVSAAIRKAVSHGSL